MSKRNRYDEEEEIEEYEKKEEMFSKRIRRDEEESDNEVDMESESDEDETEREIEALQNEQRRVQITGRRIVTTKSVFIPAVVTVEDDRPPGIPNIMLFSPEQRKEWIRQSPNPYGWPLEYLDIYNREKLITDPEGFQGTMRIDGVKLYKNQGDQFVGREEVRNMKNKNCIKSKFKQELDLDEISFKDEFILTLLDQNPNILHPDFDGFGKYYSSKLYFDEQYRSTREQIINENIGKFPTPELEKRTAETLDYFDSLYIQQIKEEYGSKRYLNKFEWILLSIKYFLGEYSQFVCVAGGFSLAKYLYENYGQVIDFNDIDLFIHSCDKNTIGEIFKRLSYITGEETEDGEKERGIWRRNDNVLSSYFSYKKTNSFIKFHNTTKAIQIIKRLYTCPAQVILGFDVDSCCILTTLDGETYASERCCYAIRNGYNMMNFDRMSPSYEYRLCKYNKRGFAIWIPFIEHFKANAVFDGSRFDKTKLSTIIIKHLTSDGDFRGYRREEKSDYKSRCMFRINFDVKMSLLTATKFKTLNPGEQISNTFHKIVLEDPIYWYPTRGSDIFDNFQVNNQSLEIKELTRPILFNSYTAMNIIKKTKMNRKPDQRSIDTSKRLIDKIDQLLPDSIIKGGLVTSAITGYYTKSLKIYNPHNLTKRNKDLFSYEMCKYRTLVAISNSLSKIFPGIDKIEPELLGRIVFTDKLIPDKQVYIDLNVENRSAISEEENFKNFLKYTSKSEFSIKTSYNSMFNSVIGHSHIDNNVKMSIEFKKYKSETKEKPTFKSNNIFYPSEMLEEHINRYIQTDEFITEMFGIDPAEFKLKCSTEPEVYLRKLIYEEDGLRNLLRSSKVKILGNVIHTPESIIPVDVLENIDLNVKLCVEMIQHKKYKEVYEMLGFKKLSFSGMKKYDIERIKERDDLYQLDENCVNYYRTVYINTFVRNEIKIKIRLIEIYIYTLIVSNNLQIFKLLFIRKHLRSIPCEFNITFEDKFSEDLIEDMFYRGGKFYCSDYESALLNVGVSLDQISNGKVLVLEYPAYEQFIPC